MLLECHGTQVGKFYLPPFEVKAGDFVLINLFGGGHHRDLSATVVDILTGKIADANVKIHTPFSFAARFEESKFRYHFYPTTVGEYLRKNANIHSPFYEKIYEYKYIHEKIKIQTLAGTPAKKLSVYSILSKKQPIILSSAHIDPIGAKEIYDTVLAYSKAGNAVILLDWGNEYKNQDIIYVEIAQMNEDGKGFSAIVLNDSPPPIFTYPNPPKS
jgi:hypothetical protein